ncbi:MAG: hypothetical protein WCS30_00070 [Selenomonadaceae bacterium]
MLDQKLKNIRAFLSKETSDNYSVTEHIPFIELVGHWNEIMSIIAEQNAQYDEVKMQSRR